MFHVSCFFLFWDRSRIELWLIIEAYRPGDSDVKHGMTLKNCQRHNGPGVNVFFEFNWWWKQVYILKLSVWSSHKDGATFLSSYPQVVAKLAVIDWIMLTNCRQAVVKKISKSINDSWDGIFFISKNHINEVSTTSLGWVGKWQE